MKQQFTAIRTTTSIDVRLIESVIVEYDFTCNVPVRNSYDVCAISNNVVRVTPIARYDNALGMYVTPTQAHIDSANMSAIKSITGYCYRICTLDNDSVLVYLNSFKPIKSHK